MSEDEIKVIMKEFDQTIPLADAINTQAINFNIGEFNQLIVRTIWSHYRKNNPNDKYSNITQYLEIDNELLKWYNDSNIHTIFNNFIKHDTHNKPLYLVFCRERGDEIIIRRVIDDLEKPYFQIIECLFSQFANCTSRNQLGPIREQRNEEGEIISIFISTL
jgi:kynurenine formamidase